MANINRRRSTPSTDGQQSLMTAINRFVQAVDLMDDTVMIPCRLRDIPVESIPIPCLQEENNNKAVIPAIPVSGDLYHFYAMLHAIRSEIIAGPLPIVDDDQSDNTDDSVDESDPIGENAKKTAAAFRYHLRGLFGLLHQMTETAKYLSNRYEREVTCHNGISSVSSFNM
ncbi:mid1-interacting protein 1-B [Biomphalaria glabrata]|nr:mid1-interacting protein 1-B [Biomphalaria glabrata]